MKIDYTSQMVNSYIEDTINCIIDNNPHKGFGIHAHFYQPPREEPLSGEIPREPSAFPYHDWNERINAECYAPNAALGNFEHISFNLGATLARWMERFDPVTYNRILSQDRSAYLRTGYGSAIAQPYHHIILPLASEHEKDIQIYWGLMDFQHRFGRQASGMWLPETAVDLQTLDILTRYGVRFTILAPWQAEGEIDALNSPYVVKLEAKQQIAVFFYHQGLSTGISFEDRMTMNAHRFMSEYVKSLMDNRIGNGYLLLASDGELYGHHKPFRDWFLAYLVHSAAQRSGVRVINPAQWISLHPPSHNVRIAENTSWSCLHGIQRWKGNCDCIPGSGEWKYILRNALNQLASDIDTVYQEEIRRIGLAPWEFLKGYGRVLVGAMSFRDYLVHEAGINLPVWKIAHLENLIRAMYFRMQMFTSCGWFFDRVDRIESRRNIKAAGYAAWLVYISTGIDLWTQLERSLDEIAFVDGETAAAFLRKYLHQIETHHKIQNNN